MLYRNPQFFAFALGAFTLAGWRPGPRTFELCFTPFPRFDISVSPPVPIPAKSLGQCPGYPVRRNIRPTAPAASLRALMNSGAPRTDPLSTTAKCRELQMAPVSDSPSDSASSGPRAPTDQTTQGGGTRWSGPGMSPSPREEQQDGYQLRQRMAAKLRNACRPTAICLYD